MTTEIVNPTLYEVKELTRDYGLVGEEQTVLTVFCSFLGGGFVVMLGLSSGGKDEVVNAAEFCVPDGWVFKVPTSMSQTTLYQQHEAANSAHVHRHKDISNISGKSWLEDIWKAHGDGRSISHSWTQVMGQEREERRQTLYPPNALILFLAEDNEQVDINDYPEVRNRALLLTIDDSRSLTKLVNERQAKIRAGITDFRVGEERAEEIREYVSTIPVGMYDDDGQCGFLNPVGPALDNQNPLPQHFTEARRDFPRLADFMESVALFHHHERMEVPSADWPQSMRIDNLVTTLVTPADAWLSMRVFGEKMVLSALNLRDKDFHLLDVLRSNYGQQFDVGQLQMRMQDRGWNITDHDVRRSLKNMKVKGYVRVDKDRSPHMWSASEFAKQVSREVELDWPQIVTDTKELVRENYPQDVADEYISSHCEGAGLIVTHPISGHMVNLAEQSANELEKKVEKQEAREQSTAFGTEPLDNDDDDSDGNFQGTLQ